MRAKHPSVQQQELRGLGLGSKTFNSHTVRSNTDTICNVLQWRCMSEILFGPFVMKPCSVESDFFVTYTLRLSCCRGRPSLQTSGNNLCDAWTGVRQLLGSTLESQVNRNVCMSLKRRVVSISHRSSQIPFQILAQRSGKCSFRAHPRLGCSIVKRE